MKVLLLLLLFPALSFSQKTEAPDKSKSKMYGYFGGTSFISKKFDNRAGITLGIGYSPDSHFGVGAGIDIFMFSKNIKFAQAYGEFRMAFNGLNTASPFISLQPGIILYNHDDHIGQTTIITKGSFAGNALVGMAVRPENKLGFFFALGYSNISFSVNKIITHYDGIKAEIGISF